MSDPMSAKKVPGARLGVLVTIKENEEVLFVEFERFRIIFNKLEKDKMVSLQFRRAEPLFLKKGEIADQDARGLRIADAIAILKREGHTVLSS